MFGYVISRYLSSQPGLAPGLAVGVALVSCMPGGTASNIVAYIAKGDMVGTRGEKGWPCRGTVYDSIVQHSAAKLVGVAA